MVSEKEYQQTKSDLAFYERRRRLFLILGLSFMGLFILLFALSVIVVVSTQANGQAMGTIAGMPLTASIIFFVLRGVLYRSRILQRKAIVEEYEATRSQL